MAGGADGKAKPPSPPQPGGRQWVRRRVWWRAFLTGAVVLLATAATATASLVLEDWLPVVDSSGAPRQAEGWNAATLGTTRLRLVILVVVLVALLVALRLRLRAGRTAGTLYYVRLLDENQSDMHVSAVSDVAQSHVDLRVIAGWLSDANGRPIPPDRSIDISEEVGRLSERLLEATDTDQVATGFSIAPNLPLPVALAIGYDYVVWPGTYLDELNGALHWKWSPSPADTFSARQRGLWVMQRERVGIATGPVLLRVTMTPPRDFRPLPARFDVGSVYSLGLRAPGTIERPRMGQTPLGVLMTTTRRKRYEPLDAETATAAHADPAGAAVAFARGIRRALIENENSLVVVQARVPKTVAFAAGWHLRAMQGEREFAHPAAARPWRRLIVLADDGKAASCMRVHPSQPPLDAMRALLDFTPDSTKGPGLS